MQTTDQAVSIEDAVEALVAEPTVDDNSGDDIDSAADELMASEEPDTDEGSDPQPEPEGDIEEADEDSDDDEPETDEVDEEELDAEEDEDEADQDGTEKLHTVKVDGEEQQVTLDDLKRGFSGQAKIQKGMRENAERAKQLEQAAQQVAQQSQAAINLYNRLNQNGVVPQPKAPDYDSFKDDPLGYWEADAKYKTDLQAWQAQQQEVQQAAQAQQRKQQAQMNQYREQQRQMLVEKIPEIANPETRQQMLGEFVDAAKHYGFSAEEVGDVLDHRAFLMLKDAMAFRNGQASKKKAEAKIKKAKKVVKAGAKKPDSSAARKAKAARNRLKNTGHIDDAASLLLGG